MNIGRQWTDRLKIWAEQFEKHYYAPCGEIPVRFFTTMEQLRLAEAVNGSFVPAEVGMKWGKKWEYGWFSARIVIPPELDGKRVVFTLNTAEEMLVWVNGVESGAIDKKHKYITLTRCARAGAEYEIMAECYAGHGVRNEGAGPVAHGEESVPEPKEPQVTVGRSTFGIWNEELFQVAMDYLTLYSLVQKLPEKSLRTMKIVEGLKKFTYIADFELPEPEMTASIVAAGEVLKPLLACKNGSTAPDYTVFGQSHLDLAWLWSVEETKRKSARTYSNQLALMEEYEDYQFLLCEGQILAYLKELYPNVYKRVQEKAKSGAFIPEGAMWVESDTNIPSGESLIRQFALGKRHFREEWGVESKMAWMPDTFGFSPALPQIMKKCGIPYFATQKLVRQDPEAEPFPYNVFYWEGMDGSRVLSHLFKKNNAVFQAGDLITRWEEDRVQQENIDGLIFPFGYGDGGGGPTREMIEMARRCKDLEGAPRCRMESPVKFFERQQNVENTYCGELYLAWHRGTLTSQAKTKRGIRKAEIALRQVEFALSRCMLNGRTVEKQWKDELSGLWGKLLFNQFHDVAPGTSIRRVHDEAEKDLGEVVAGCKKLLKEILGQPGEKSVVYNHLSWDRRIRGQMVAAQSSAVLENKKTNKANVRFEENNGGYYELSNEYLICRVNKNGELTSVKLRGKEREFLAGAGNRFLMFKDVNTCYDAWELGSMYENMPVAPAADAKVEICEDSDGVALRVARVLGGSSMTQKILLGHDAIRLDFVTEIDWQEKHKMLKVAFPVNVYTKEAIQEVQFGYVKRPTHRSRQSDRDRYEVSNHRYTVLCDGGAGAAVLNDCKYGVNTVDHEIRLTLLKAPMMPDMHADRGVQEFTYSFCPFVGAFSDSEVLHQAVELNEGVIFGGEADDCGAIFVGNRKNIVVETVKPSDTVENALLVRAYEAMGQATEAEFTISTRVRRVCETDMLEENGVEIPVDGTVKASFGAFEIKTFLLYL